MKRKFYEILLITLPILVLAGGFEMYNISDYKKEMVEMPIALIESSGEPAHVKENKIKVLVREGLVSDREKYIDEAVTIFLLIGWILLIYYYRSNASLPASEIVYVEGKI